MTETVAPLALARRYVEVDQPQRALEALGNAGGDELENPEFWMLQSAARFDLGEYEEASRAARQGLDRSAQDTHLLYLLAMAETQAGRVAEAETAILSALELSPDDPGLLCAYARVAARANQLEKAQRLLDAAERIDRELAEVTHLRAFLAFLRGKDRQAASYADQILAESPEDPHAHRLRGAALVNQGRYRKAGGSFASAVRDNPTDHELASVARSARAGTHPLLWPMIPFQVLGPAPSWVAAMAIIFGSRAAGLTTISAIAAITWLVLAIYSWTAAPAIVRWLERRGP